MLYFSKKEDVWIFDYYFDEDGRVVVFQGKDESGNTYEYHWWLIDSEENKWKEKHFKKNNSWQSNKFKRKLNKENRNKIEEALFYIAEKTKEFIEKNIDDEKMQHVHQVIREEEDKIRCKVRFLGVRMEIGISFELNDEKKWEMSWRSHTLFKKGEYYEGFLINHLFLCYYRYIEKKILSHPSLRLYTILT